MLTYPIIAIRGVASLAVAIVLTLAPLYAQVPPAADLMQSVPPAGGQAEQQLSQQARGYDVPSYVEQEINRRGNFVERLGGGHQNDPASVYGNILGPPAEDSYKWYISVITTPGCQYCTALLRDFNTNPALRSFANPADSKSSWSHFNVYNAADSTQQWRYQAMQIRGFPTILVQPPRNGTYGDSAIVVAQLTGYSGDPEALAERIRSAITGYAAKVSSGYVYRGGHGASEVPVPGIVFSDIEHATPAVGAGNGPDPTPLASYDGSRPAPFTPPPQPYNPYYPQPSPYQPGPYQPAPYQPYPQPSPCPGPYCPTPQPDPGPLLPRPLWPGPGPSPLPLDIPPQPYGPATGIWYHVTQIFSGLKTQVFSGWLVQTLLLVAVLAALIVVAKRLGDLKKPPVRANAPSGPNPATMTPATSGA